MQTLLLGHWELDHMTWKQTWKCSLVCTDTFLLNVDLDGQCTTLTNQISQFFPPYFLWNSWTRAQNSKWHPIVLSLRYSNWMVKRMRNLLELSPIHDLISTCTCRGNPVLYDKNHKDYRNKAVTNKVFAPILIFWTSFQALVWWISVTPKQVSFICSRVCTIIWSKLPLYASSCVLVVQIDPGACSGSKTLRVYRP